MKLLVVYAFFVVIGEAIAYGIGRGIEAWSQPASLPAFLGLFFVMLWAAWRAAVLVA